MPLTEHQFHRYARHLILDEVGEEGQEKLLRAHVLVVGAGGLGLSRGTSSTASRWYLSGNSSKPSAIAEV